MAEKMRRSRIRNTSQEYLDGTAVRRERRSRERADVREEKEVSALVRKNRERARHVTLPYALLLAAATLAAGAVCYQYLGLQSSIAKRKYNIQSLQSSLSELQTQNDALQDSIDLYTDLDQVYQTATEKLGMVYPDDDQVILYDKTESEYVRQYEDIPTDG